MSGQAEAERLNTLAVDVLEYGDCTAEGATELAKGVVALQAQVEQGAEESNRHRIEADCAMRDFDGLELDLGIANDALRKIAEPRPNQKFDPWARDVARRALSNESEDS